jgi:site-specific DNA-methyltransferase (adenine-specific)
MLSLNTIHQGDCLKVIKQIEDNSIDLILCDLPYGTTKNKWDTPIDLIFFWKECERVIKDRGVIVLIAKTPFDKVLGTSNLKLLKYELIWEKSMATGHLNSKFAPLKKHENILIFSKSAGSFVRNKDNAMVYNPQMTKGKAYTCRNGRASTNYDYKNYTQVVTENKGERYPVSIIKFNHDKEKLHPTQKPIALFEYLIKQYSNKGDVVFDMCAGSGTTAIASINTGRNWICIESDEKYFEIALKRIKEHAQQSTLLPLAEIQQGGNGVNSSHQ